MQVYNAKWGISFLLFSFLMYSNESIFQDFSLLSVKIQGWLKYTCSRPHDISFLVGSLHFVSIWDHYAHSESGKWDLLTFQIFSKMHAISLTPHPHPDQNQNSLLVTHQLTYIHPTKTIILWIWQWLCVLFSRFNMYNSFAMIPL